jgi:hypothetical protein
VDQELITTIRKTLEAKSTEELRRSYEAQDQAAWSAEAFEAMRQLLAERGERDLRAPAARSRQGFAYSGLAEFALSVGTVCACLGCILTVVWAIADAAKGQGGYALIVGPLGFFLQLAMVVVFLRVRDLRG